jgi:predicted site-specific integrase-resolvase
MDTIMTLRNETYCLKLLVPRNAQIKVFSGINIGRLRHYPMVIEHRARLMRFGIEYVEAALAAQGRKLLVIDPDEMKDEGCPPCFSISFL